MAISKVILNGETLMDVTQDTVASDSLLTGKTATKNDGTKITGTYATKLEPLTVKSTDEAQVFDGSLQTTEINGAMLESGEMDSGDSNTLTSSLVWRSSRPKAALDTDAEIIVGQKYHLSGWFGTGDTEETAQRIFFDTDWVARETQVSIPFTTKPGYSDDEPSSFDGSIEFTEIKLSSTEITITATAPFIVYTGFDFGGIYLSVSEIGEACDGYIPVTVKPVKLRSISVDPWQNAHEVYPEEKPDVVYESLSTITIASASNWNDFGGDVFESLLPDTDYFISFTIRNVNGYSIAYPDNSVFQLDGNPIVLNLRDRQGDIAGTITIDGIRFKIDSTNVSDGYTIENFKISSPIDGFSLIEVNAAALQNKTVSPSESSQTVTADSSYYGLSQVTVNAISSTYVGSAIPLKSAADVAINGTMGTIIAPSGYYSKQTSVAAPTANMELTTSMNSNFGSVFWSYTNTSTGVVLPRDTYYGSYQLPILSAQTITPGSTSQYISSYQWLTGLQTIAAIPSDYIGSAIPEASVYTPTMSTYTETNGTLWASITTSYTSGYLSVNSTMQRSQFLMYKLESNNMSYSVSCYKLAAPTNISIELTTNYSKLTDNIKFVDSNTIFTNNISAELPSYHAIMVQMYLQRITSCNDSEIAEFINYNRYIPSYAFIGNYKISNINNVDNILSIYDYAFCSCNKLTTVDFPNATSIGYYAFYSCASLTTVNFPKATRIGASAFCSCYSLSSISFPSATNIGPYAFYSCSKLTTVDFPNATSIGSNAFCYCSKLTTVDFPNATSIGYYAFCSCYSLSSISFPSATNIWDGAFYNCNKLTMVDFPNVTSIGVSAFYKCASLSSISFPKATYIGASAFYSCSKLTTVDFPSVTSIGISAFYSCSKLTTVDFPNVTSIGGYAFYSCSKLTTVDFPNVTSIGGYAFYSCDNLSSISFPNVTRIGGYAFYSCISLKAITFPNATSIGDNAFYNCYNLSTISFPNVTSIGSSAFYSCGSLSSISFPNVTSIGVSAFYKCASLSSISFPKATYIGASAFYSCSKLTTVDFPSVTSIGGYAFYSCDNLSSINFPSATYVGQLAFGCEALFSSITGNKLIYYLSSIYLPNVSTIGYGAFMNRGGLKAVSFPAVKTISGVAFYNAIDLISAYFLGSTVPSLSADIFGGTPINLSKYTGSYGSIFVRASMVDAFNTASVWSTYSSRIVGLTDEEIAALD